MYEGVKNYHEALEKAGIKHVYYESPGTAHEWLTWRRSLHEFAPLLFVNAPARPAAARPGPRRPIVLNPDDVPAFPDPPAGIDAREGRAARASWRWSPTTPSRSARPARCRSIRRRATPTEKKYPVLYLLHGIGGDETEWQRFAKPNILLDNLLAEGKVAPMIVVMPNGRARRTTGPRGTSSPPRRPSRRSSRTC